MEAPPPYSETDPSDISSNAGTTTSSTTLPALTQSAAYTGTSSSSSRTLPSAASSADDVVYTPPYSPASSSHQPHIPNDDYGHISSSAARAYFDSRPAQRIARQLLVHSITVQWNTQPNQLPFPESFQARDVTGQDWYVFSTACIPTAE